MRKSLEDMWCKQVLPSGATISSERPKSPQIAVLHISYASVTEPLIQNQVIPYLAGLAQSGYQVYMLTFEIAPWDRETTKFWRKRLGEKLLKWRHLRYHKRPTLPATAFDILMTVIVGWSIIRKHNIFMVHARSHVPAAAGLILKYLTGCRLLFDIRGLLAEEYEDAGHWSRTSIPFRMTKHVEQKCLNNADGIVVLTQRIRDILFAKTFDRPISVIPCCVDVTNLSSQATERDVIRKRLGVQGKTVVVYSGKLGTWYLHEEMARFMAVAMADNERLHFLILTPTEPHMVIHSIGALGVDRDDFTVLKVKPEEVGAYLAAADYGISFIAACPSKVASSPTKIGEYLACGLPVLSNRGIGDMDQIIEQGNVGYLVKEFTDEEFLIAAQAMRQLCSQSAIRSRCQNVARSYASLEEIGIPRYRNLYDRVTGVVQ